MRRVPAPAIWSIVLIALPFAVLTLAVLEPVAILMVWIGSG